MEFTFTPLGVSAAQPAYGRHLAAHILSVGPESFLLDCGEGTQFQFNSHGIKRNRIGHVFISHLHGDHFFGLIGLLNSLGMNDRKEPLRVYAPPGLEEIIEVQFRITQSGLPFPLHFQALDPSLVEKILETEHVEVHSFPLAHRTPTLGFLFREKQIPLNIIPDAIDRYGLTFEQIRAVKAGEELRLPDGRLIPNTELTLPPYRPRSFAYCSDTAYKEDLVPVLKGVDLLYHESTFLEKDAEMAAITLHSTAAQAARIAKLAGAGTLLLGHYSARYPDAGVFLEEAKPIFPNTLLSEEGKAVEIPLIRTTSPNP